MDWNQKKNLEGFIPCLQQRHILIMIGYEVIRIQSYCFWLYYHLYVLIIYPLCLATDIFFLVQKCSVRENDTLLQTQIPEEIIKVILA